VQSDHVEDLQKIFNAYPDYISVDELDIQNKEGLVEFLTELAELQVFVVIWSHFFN